jgi:hypothetical protein
VDLKQVQQRLEELAERYPLATVEELEKRLDQELTNEE